MTDRHSIQGYRLRRSALELEQFTVGELSSLSGTERETVEQFIFKLKREIPGIFAMEPTAPKGVGRPPTRYRLSPDGMRTLASRNAALGRKLRDALSLKTPPAEIEVPTFTTPLEPVQAVPFPEVNVRSWINSLGPAFVNALGQGALLMIRPSEPVIMRLGRAVAPLTEVLTLSMEEILQGIKLLLTPWQLARLEKQGWTAGSYAFPHQAPVYLQVEIDGGKPTIRLRNLATQIPTPQDLRLSSFAERLASMKVGLILVTGIARSGRSATMAALVNSINTGQKERIATIEEPIHYFYPQGQSFVEQKQVAIDAPDFGPALQLVLRNNADVIALSDVNDPQIFSTVLEAAERNLMFCRISAATPGEAVGDTIGLFPGEEQSRLRARMAQNLAGIISVKGLPELSGETAVRPKVLEWRPEMHALILDPKRTPEITDIVEKHGEGESTQESVERLYNEGRVSAEILARHGATRSA